MKAPLYFLLLACLTANAQINSLIERWSKLNGIQSGNYKNNTLLDEKGNAYISGAKKNNSSTHDGYVTKLDSKGQTIWSYNYIGPGNGDDVVISTKLDAEGNIYITGTVYQNNTNHADLFVAKLNENGVLVWNRTFNGGASGFDAGGDVLVDNQGDVYVVGTASNTSSMLDFVILKYNNLGNQVWQRYYDHSNLNDAATKIVLIGDSLYVCGISQNTSNNWELSTLCLNKLDGVMGNHITSGGTGAGIDKINQITSDVFGNIYLTGSVLNSNYDARIIKFNPNLNIIWSKDYNGPDNLDDEGLDIKVDQNGNVYLAGYTSKLNESKNILLIKYNSNGDTVFTSTYNGTGNGNDQANGLSLAQDGSIYITGSVKNLNEEIVTTKYSATGEPVKTKTYAGSGNSTANSISIGTYGQVIVSGQVEENGVKKNITINYLENLEWPNISNNQILQQGAFRYLEGALLVRFHPACFNLDVMDNKKIYNQYFGVLMKDTILKTLTQIIYGNQDPTNVQSLAKMVANKPFYFLDSNDTLSLSRNASLVRVPQFWATLMLYLPPGFNVTRTTNLLDDCWPFVRFYDLVPIADAYSVPNDEYYQSRQKSLHYEANYPDADINVEEAWDIETGKKFIRVGVNDTGADSLHPDLKWQRRYNIVSNYGEVPNDTHGTHVGGIIGAKRNNQLGIAGIAGGNGNDSTGVSMFNLFILPSPITADVLGVYSTIAITLGATQLIREDILNLLPDYHQYFMASDTGLALNVMNHSYGINYGTLGPDLPIAGLGDCKICYEAMEYSYRNGVINVASRGNETIANFDAATDSIFPSCVKDEMVISVSASGYNGQFKTYDNNDPSSPLNDNYMSMYGRHVDVMAPGTTANVYTTNLSTADSIYTSFNGTSASAPHVTGTVALMLSHVNQPCPCEKNLTPEDVEYILQKTASQRSALVMDGNTIMTPGPYNPYSGWGMLDAGKALKAVEQPKNQIIHVTEKNPTIDSLLVAQNVAVHLYNPYTTYETGYRGSFSSIFNVDSLLAGYNPPPNGPYPGQASPSIDKTYLVDIYKVRTTINHSGKTNHFSGAAILQDAWIRNSSSIGWKLDSCIRVAGQWVCDSIDVSQNVYFDTTDVTLQSAGLYTYVYKFKRIIENWDGQTYMQDIWYPCKPRDVEFAYSLYVYDSLATSVPNYPCAYLNGIKEMHSTTTNSLTLFPNPNAGELNLVIELADEEKVQIEVYDLSGRNVQTIEKGKLMSGKHYLKLDTGAYTQGVYLIKASTEKKTIANQKFIKL